jgi:MFS family permease
MDDRLVSRETVRLVVGNLCSLSGHWSRSRFLCPFFNPSLYGDDICDYFFGIMNTAIATACTRLAGKEEVGGLYGALESVESIGGIIGPVLGGILQKQSNSLPVIAVVMIYASVFVGIYFFYEKHILSVSVSESAKSHKD